MKIREPASLVIALLLGMLIGSYFNSDRLFVATLGVLSFFSIEILLLHRNRSSSAKADAPKKKAARYTHLSIGLITISLLTWSLAATGELIFHCLFISATLAYLTEVYTWPTESEAGKNHAPGSEPDKQT